MEFSRFHYDIGGEVGIFHVHFDVHVVPSVLVVFPFTGCFDGTEPTIGQNLIPAASILASLAKCTSTLG